MARPPEQEDVCQRTGVSGDVGEHLGLELTAGRGEAGGLAGAKMQISVGRTEAAFPPVPSPHQHHLGGPPPADKLAGL